jgi:DNA helicase-2/ATP-dependent DNA helicase PcrA
MQSYQEAAEELRANAEQWRAFEQSGNVAILAGPGSGKTKLLTVKLARVVEEDVHLPRKVACITYNNECVAEIRRRLLGLGVNVDERAFLGTVHSFCLSQVIRPFAHLARLVVPNPLRIASDQLQQQVLQDATNARGRGQSPDWFRPQFDCYRRNHLNRAAPEWSFADPELADVVTEYERRLHALGYWDFDDIIISAADVLRNHPTVRRILAAKYPVLFVDEYQDLGLPLHQIVQSLCFDTDVRLVAVGDPDQSIYGFTGAKPELLREVAGAAGVTAIRLRHNYRSGRKIVAAAEVVLQEARGYTCGEGSNSEIETLQCAGLIDDQCVRAFSELVPRVMRDYGLRLGEIAVLYPNKNQGSAAAAYCNSNSIPYVRNDRGAPYPRTRIVRWLEDAASWCVGKNSGPGVWKDLLGQIVGLLSSGRPIDSIAAQDIKQRCARFLWKSRSTPARLREWLTEFRGLFSSELSNMATESPDESGSITRLNELSETSMADYLVENFAFSGGSLDTLNLLTLHSAKGLEFGAVIIIGLDEGVFPTWNATTTQIAENRRLFYVGITRAKRHVALVYSGYTVNKYNRRYYNGPTRFVAELQAAGLV